ncbi:MAG: histidine phosphatase family protein [Rhizomicrobium sp.]
MAAPSLSFQAPTTILLIRHAQSAPSDEVPEAQWPLSPKGVRQALALAKAAPLRRIAHIYSSPYRRALDTVAPLAARLGLSVTPVPELRERKLTDEPRNDWEHLLRQAWADHDFALPGAESGRAVQSRMHEALLGLALRHPGERLAVASHGNAIALFLNRLDPAFGFAEWKAMRNPDIFSVTWRESGWRRNALPALSISP